MTAAAFLAFIDDYCGNGRTPGPHPPRPQALSDLLTATAIFQLASKLSNGALKDQIQRHATDAYTAAGKAIAGGA